MPMPAKLPHIIPVSDLEHDATSKREILALLAQGEKEIAEEKGYDLDDVLADADSPC